ncbi:MAG: CHAT domain-containing protein [Acidobacteriota bacterium]
MAALQMGDHYKKARTYQDALTYYRLALSIRPLPGAVRTNALNSIALTYAGLYLHDLAVRYFNEALSQARVINDRPAQILALSGLADLYRRQGADLYRRRDALEKARSNITSALQLRKRDHADDDPSLLHLNGQISREQGLVENARSAFEKALTIYQNTGKVAGQVKVLCELSTLSLLVSQKQAALEQAEQAVKLAEMLVQSADGFGDKVSARELRWPAFVSRARAERALGQRERALNSFSSAINNTTAVWWSLYLATEASAVAFREEVQSAYRECVDLLMEQGQTKRAYDLVEQAKGRTLLTFNGARRARPRSVDDKHATALRDSSRSIALLRTQLLDSGISREKRAKLQEEIEDAEFKMDEARLNAEMEHSNDRLVWSPPATADHVLEQMTKAEMTLAEFSLGEKRSFLWLFTRGEVFVETLPARKEIEEAVRPYLELLGASPSPLCIERDLTKLRERSGALFAKLFGSLSGRVEPGRRLIVVPDGLLHYLPFETLIHNGHYLVEDHEISYLPSAGILLQLQDSRSDVETGDRMELLAFGDPTFSLELKASIPKKRKSKPANLVRSARESRGFRLQQLPRTSDEVRYIAGLFPADRTRLYLGKDSTEDAVKRESLRRYRRLHFATHSLIDENSPSRSAVVLAQDKNTDEDGFLEVSEISDLDLDCDLVVLSACQTGRGRLLSGEGIVGLSRAFLYAGARAVVVSHWNVSDISTSQLMKSFYQHLTAGMSNAAALRATKLQMLKSDKETRHPYYWASFVIVGKT